MLLVGAAGTGKTAVAKALIEEVRPAATNEVMWLAANAAGPAIPFGAFAPLVPQVGGDLRHNDLPFDLLQTLRREVLARAAGKHPLLVVDDAHRLDDASATLVFQLVSAGSASAIVTSRAGAALPEGVRALWKDGLIERIDLQALGRLDTIRLAAELLDGQVDGVLGQALWRMSAGNPLYLRELIWAGRAAGRIVAQHGLWRLEERLTIGPRLSELIQERLARLSRHEMSTLEIVAVGEPVPLDILTRLTPGVHVSSLQRQGFLVAQHVRGEPQELVRPAHPLYGEVVRAGLAAPRLRDLRAELAAAFEASGRLRSDLLRLVTWQLDTEGVDDPELLLTASRGAADQQDWKLSARLADAALSVTKDTAASMLLAEALDHQGRHLEALTALAGCEGDGDDEAARLACLRAHILHFGLGRVDEADRLLLTAETTIADSSHRAWVAAIRAGLTTFCGRPEEAAAHLRPLLDTPGLSSRATVSGRAALALSAAWSGRASEAVEAAESCLEPGLQAADDTPVSVRWTVLACLSAYRLAGRLHDLEALAVSEYERSIQVGNTRDQGVAAGALGWVSLARGRLTAAAGQFRESVAVLHAVDWTTVRSQSLAGLAESLALTGDADAAEAAVEEAGVAPVLAAGTPTAAAPIPPAPDSAAGPAGDAGIEAAMEAAMEASGYDDLQATGWVWSGVETAKAWASAARGQLSRSVDAFRAAASAARAKGQVGFELMALHGAARLGDVEAADRLAAMATWMDGPLVQAVATQAVAMAAGSGPGLDRAAEVWESMTMWLYAAECSASASRAHTLAGSRRQAAASASRAEALFDHCEGPRPVGLAVTWAAPALTRREREVALLAQTGLSSHAIAERLYLSVRTVDSHLARIYTKLGITGRRELAAALLSLSSSPPSDRHPATG